MAKGVVSCDLCGKEFEKEVRATNEARKRGWKIFCSRTCYSKAKRTSQTVRCLTCGADVVVAASVVRKSKTGKFYCSKSCAARMRNLGRHRTEEEKKKISKALFGKRHNVGLWQGLDRGGVVSTCCVCGKEFSHPTSRDRVACSIKCGEIYQFGSLPYTKEEAIALIAKIREATGATPSTKMVERKVVCAILKYFKSWNEAMKSLGYEPNTQWMTKKKLKCQDGHRADSISELVVDNWFYKHGICHERSKPYPEGRMNCDFFLPDFNMWVEYFGLSGQHPKYDEKIVKKREMAVRCGMKLVEVMPCHLYPKMKLDELFRGCE